MNSRKEKEVIKRNAELKQQLVANARKLKIEAGLEKVRAVALKMKKPADMLDVCKTISLQLQKLGVKEIRNVQTAIFYESKGTYMNYEYYAKHKKTFITETVYTNHKIAKAFATKMMSGKGEFYSTHIKGKKVKDWLAYQKTTNVFIDRFLEKANSLNYYWHSLGPVALGISTYDPLREEDLNLFKRFLKVFELAYKRYLDIEKAMLQARAAQIEAALERVRAVAMSMRKAEDLAAVSEIIFTELKLFGFADIRNTEIIVNKDTKNSITSYYYSDYGITGTIDVDITTHTTVKHWMEELKKTNDSFAAVHISEKEMKEWRKYRESLGYLPDPKLNKVKTVEYYSYSIGPGAISVSSFKPITEEQLKTLERFKNVFGLAYRRYSDVAKAEAQAREAQIEAALEKVRSRSLAMHKSDELSDVVIVLFEMMKKLNIRSDGININVTKEGSKSIESWLAAPGGVYSVCFHIPYFEHQFMKDIFSSIANNSELLNKVYSFEEKKSFFTYLYNNTDFKTLPEERKQLVLNAKSWEVSIAFAKNMALSLHSYSGIIFTQDENEILKRFAKVFEQSYTRFLDLQKAEAQAREAKIEVALERTRTQSMIMQHSKELDDTLRVFHEQVLLLGIPSAFSFLWLPDEKNDRHIFWAVWEENKNGSKVFKSKAINYPLDKNEPATAQCLVDWKSNEAVFSYQVQPAAVENYFAVWQELIDGVEHLRPEYFSGGLYYVEAFMKYGCFGVMVTTDLTEEEKKLLNRFAIEFERTYTRFLDLQKAEAQAKEAQIEAALKKIRSRSLAMHKSEELKDVVTVLFEKLRELGLDFDGTGIQLFIEGSRNSVLWIRGVILSEPVLVNHPYDEVAFTNSEILRDIWHAKEKAVPVFNKAYSFKEKNKLVEYTGKYNKGNGVPPEVVEAMMQATGYTATFIMEKNSGLWVDSWSGKQITVEEFNVSKRVAKVFEQAYIRFLDLQKAEAQTRESQIQLALERVRART